MAENPPGTLVVIGVAVLAYRQASGTFLLARGFPPKRPWLKERETALGTTPANHAKGSGAESRLAQNIDFPPV